MDSKDRLLESTLGVTLGMTPQTTLGMTLGSDPGSDPWERPLGVTRASLWCRQLQVGNVARLVGYLRYEGFWTTPAFIAIMVVTALVLTVLLALLALFCYRRTQDPHYVGLFKRRATTNPYVGGTYVRVCLRVCAHRVHM